MVDSLVIEVKGKGRGIEDGIEREKMGERERGWVSRGGEKRSEGRDGETYGRD